MNRSWLIMAILLVSMPSSLRAETHPASADSTQIRARIVESLRTQLPPAPTGFSWEFFKDAAFLRPDGWTSKTDAIASGKNAIGMTAFAESPETFSAAKSFSTGFTVQIISGTQASDGITATQAAAAYLKPFVAAHKREDILLLDHRQDGANVDWVLKYRDAPDGQVAIIVHKFLIVSDDLDSVHVFTFESPEASWKENWERFGTPLLQRVQVINHPVPDP
jgi:hypothetical protein